MVKIACIGAGYVGGVSACQSRQQLIGSETSRHRCLAALGPRWCQDLVSKHNQDCLVLPARRRQPGTPCSCLKLLSHTALPTAPQPTMAMIALKCPEVEVVVLDINEGMHSPVCHPAAGWLHLTATGWAPSSIPDALLCAVCMPACAQSASLPGTATSCQSTSLDCLRWSRRRVAATSSSRQTWSSTSAKVGCLAQQRWRVVVAPATEVAAAVERGWQQAVPRNSKVLSGTTWALCSRLGCEALLRLLLTDRHALVAALLLSMQPTSSLSASTPLPRRRVSVLARLLI